MSKKLKIDLKQKLNLSFMKNVAVPGALNLNDFRRMVMDNVVMNDYSSQFVLHECKPVDRALRLLDSGRFFDVDEGEEKEIIVCCPAPDVWREFNRTGKIVETYGSVFHKFSPE